MNLITGLFSGRQGLRRIILTLSITGLFLWLQLSAFNAVLGIVQNAIEGAGAIGDSSWISFFGDSIDTSWFNVIGDASQNVSGFAAFWSEWGLIISLAGLVLGVLLSNSPFKLVGQLGVIAFVLVLALPFLITALLNWMTTSGIAPELTADVGPLLIAANEQIQQHSLPILIGSSVVAVVGFGIHFLFKKGTAPRSNDPEAAAA
ncbi:MAG: hypothetical protein KF916_02270 [Microbacteriaceae bacterium]|nr:hypothetical protein [Microbacteriaceae bacterium]